MLDDLIRAFARALASMFHPRILWLMFAPFAMTTLLWGAIVWLAWDPLTQALRVWLDGRAWSAWLYSGIERVGLGDWLAALAPLLAIAVLVPLVVTTLLLYVALFSMPAAIAHLSERDYPHLEARRGGTQLGSLGNALGAVSLFLLLGIASMPLWLIPPFFAVLPPLLWGWLTYRVMRYDALMLHADAAERDTLFARHRLPLWLMGIAAGLLSTAPTWVWIASAVTVVLFPLVALLSLLIHVAIFLFSSLWFGHYCLQALARLRTQA